MSLLETIKSYAAVTTELALNQDKLEQLERVSQEITFSIEVLENKIRFRTDELKALMAVNALLCRGEGEETGETR